MSPYELPLARSYLFDHVTIDLSRFLVIHRDGRETPLAGQVAELLALLLEHPGRVLTYKQLALALMPAFADRRHWGSESLDWQETESAKHAMHALVHRARVALGERRGSPSLIINRGNIGYAIRQPCCVIAATCGSPATPELTLAVPKQVPVAIHRPSRAATNEAM